MRKGYLWAILFMGCIFLFGACAFREDKVSQAGADGQIQADGMDESESEPETGSESETTGGTESESAAEEIPVPVVQTVTVTAAGDCTLGAAQTHGYAGSFHEYYDVNGEDYFFGGVRDIFESDDFTLVNLECVLSDSNARVDKEWNLKGKPEYVGIMTGSSVEGCSLGNNHSQDYGLQSLEDTKKVLDDAGLIYGYNEHVDTYVTESGIVIGIVSASLLPRTQERANYIRDGIALLREQGAELVIASCHWGVEQAHDPDDYQRKMAHQVVDWGADLVIGTHPHVLQGVELYNGKVICYSLGNFCFGGNRNPADKDTAIYRQTFTFVDGVLSPDINADIIPCRISSITSRNDFRPTVAEGEVKAAILDNMNRYSADYSDIYFDDDGILMLKTEKE